MLIVGLCILFFSINVKADMIATDSVRFETEKLLFLNNGIKDDTLIEQYLRAEPDDFVAHVEVKDYNEYLNIPDAYIHRDAYI